MDAPGVKITDTQTVTGGGTGTPPSPMPGPAADPTVTVTGGTGVGVAPDTAELKPDWEVGDVVDGKYEVSEVIGRGGMGMVYKVHHREWDIDLAVKMPLPHVVADEVSKARFVREAQTWVDLGAHPNIVQCWYVRELGGVPRLFMDYLPGGSLKQWIREGKIRPGAWDAILDVMIQACDGLAHAHAKGVVHRDVQPANMLMSGDGRLCLTDFGLVKVGDAPEEEPAVEPEEAPASDLGLTVTGSTMGTPQYGAPEQWGEARHADNRADIYALGVVLFELACGRRPFDDGSHTEPPHVLIARHLASPAPDPRTFNPDIPPTLAQLVLACLAKDPDRRPQSMASLREILARIYAQAAGKPYTRPVPEVQRARADALNNRGVSFYDLGKRDEARSAWDEALQLDACHAEAVYNRSLLDWREGRIDDRETLRPLREALAAHPQAGFYLGLLHLERMAADEAEPALLDALDRAEPAWSGSARRALGDALMAQEKFSDAYAAYTKALLLLPGDKAAQEGLALATKRTRRRGEEAFFPWRRPAGVFETAHGEVHALAAGPGGRLLVAAGPDGEEAMALWDLHTGRALLALPGHAGAVLAAAVNADATLALSGGADGTVRLWDLAHGTLLRVLEGHAGPVRAVALSPDGRVAVSGGDDRTLRCWDPGTGACLRTLEGHADALLAAALSPDGGRAVTGGADRSVRVWDLGTGAGHHVLEGHADAVSALALTFNGAHALSAGGDRELRLWDLADGACLRTFAGHTDAVEAVAVAPGGRFAISGGADGTVRLWDLATRQCLRTFAGHGGTVKAATVTPDGRHAVTGGADGTVRRWDLGEGTPLTSSAFMVCRVGTPVLAQVTGRRFRKSLTAAQASLAAGDCRAAYAHLTMARLVKGYERDPEALGLSAKLSAHLPRTGLRASWFVRPLTGHADGVNAACVLPDGRAVSGSFDDTLRVWELPGGRCAKTIERAGWVLALAPVPDGRLLVSRSETRLHLWDLETGTCARTHLVGDQAGKGLAVTPDGRFLLAWGESRAGRIALGRWDLASGKAFRSSDPTACGRVEALAVTPDGRLGVAAGDARALFVWDLLRSRCLRLLKGHRKEVRTVAATPDSRMALSGGADRTLRLWDLESGRCLRVLEGHDGAVTSAVVTADGGFALSGGADKTLRVWDLATGQVLRVFEGHAEEVNAVTITPDGRFALSASDDRTLRLWELDWELDPDMTSKSLAEAYGLI